jgi:hypothetical protein
VRAPCVANLDTAKELLEFGVIGEAAKALVDLHRCAQAAGCEDWQNCSSTVDETWRGPAKPLPEAKARDGVQVPASDRG